VFLRLLSHVRIFMSLTYRVCDMHVVSHHRHCRRDIFEHTLFRNEFKVFIYLFINVTCAVSYRICNVDAYAYMIHTASKITFKMRRGEPKYLVTNFAYKVKINVLLK
jgi:hypothetical protein